MAIIIKYPPRGRFVLDVRVERERDGEGWLALKDACGWLHDDFSAAIADAREIAAGYGVGVLSSAGRLP
jgi:hypothetical protein